MKVEANSPMIANVAEDIEIDDGYREDAYSTNQIQGMEMRV